MHYDGTEYLKVVYERNWHVSQVPYGYVLYMVREMVLGTPRGLCVARWGNVFKVVKISLGNKMLVIKDLALERQRGICVYWNFFVRPFHREKRYCVGWRRNIYSWGNISWEPFKLRTSWNMDSENGAIPLNLLFCLYLSVWSAAPLIENIIWSMVILIHESRS